MKNHGLTSQGGNKFLHKRLEKAINENLPIVSNVDNVGTEITVKEFDDGDY